MKSLAVITMFFVLSSFASSGNNKPVEEAETTVLICTGKYSKRYHNSQCRGMKSCRGDKKKVSLSEAKKMGLTACGYCYK
ncbi:MAG: hypothetical protein LBU84_15440 [Prevotella sp.]|jgi:hypothetical protein|nr:hypothetical protein [Prevotella sp.]